MVEKAVVPTAAGRVHLSVGFVTALVSKELIACEAILESKGWTKVTPVDPALDEAGITSWHKEIEGRRFGAHTMAIGRMGQAASAIETMTFLQRCAPNYIFLTGIAGSLNAEKAKKRDVVVSLDTRWRTQNRIFGENGCDEYRKFHNPVTPYTADFSRRLQRFIEDRYSRDRPDGPEARPFDVHAADIFSWDYVIDSSRVVRRINDEFPQALCVEMEGGGFLAAVERYSDLAGKRPMRSFIVRGISDYAARKDKDATVRQDASHNAASVAVDIAEWQMRHAEIQQMAAEAASSER